MAHLPVDFGQRQLRAQARQLSQLLRVHTKIWSFFIVIYCIFGVLCFQALSLWQTFLEDNKSHIHPAKAT